MNHERNRRSGDPSDWRSWRLPFEEFLALVGAGFDEALKGHSFEKVSGRRWVRGAKQPIREIIDLQKINDLYVNPKWGFSFDYVPLVDGIEIKWHRTNRKANFDLTLDPVDMEDIRVWAIYNIPDPEMVKMAGKASALRAVSMAMSLFNRVQSVADLPALFEERLRQRNMRFGFFNYVQHPLAYAFTLAKLQNGIAAKEWLQKTFTTKLDEVIKQKLAELLEDTLLSKNIPNKSLLCLKP